MDLKQIKELMAAMGKMGIKKLSLKRDKVEIELERETACHAGYSLPEESQYSFKKPAHDLPKTKELESIANHAAAELPGRYISSPMVGTFYIAPAPDAAPFVEIGQKVKKDTVVCIIEAMKVMNEIKAGEDGVIVDRLVDSESPVEFGTKLFKISA